MLLGALVSAALLYHARQLGRSLQASRSRRPHVFLAIKGDPDDTARRRAVVLRNAGDLPARDIAVAVTRDAMIWTSREREPVIGAEARVPFSTLPVCRGRLIGLPPGGEHPVGFLTPAGRWMDDRDQELECTIIYRDGEGTRYQEKVGLAYLA
jgi:hypothetical protein